MNNEGHSEKSKNVSFYLFDEHDLTRRKCPTKNLSRSQSEKPCSFDKRNDSGRRSAGSLSPNIFSTKIEALNKVQLKVLERKNYDNDDEDLSAELAYKKDNLESIHCFHDLNKHNSTQCLKNNLEHENILQIIDNLGNLKSELHSTKSEVKDQLYDFQKDFFLSGNICKETCVKLSTNLRMLKEKLDQELKNKSALEKRLNMLEMEKKTLSSVNDDLHSKSRAMKEINNKYSLLSQSNVDQRQFMLRVLDLLNCSTGHNLNVRGKNFLARDDSLEDVNLSKVNQDAIIEEIINIKHTIKNMISSLSNRKDDRLYSSINPDEPTSELAKRALEQTLNILSKNDNQMTSIREKLAVTESENLRLENLVKELEKEKESLVKDFENNSDGLTDIMDKNSSILNEINALKSENESLNERLETKEEMIKSLKTGSDRMNEELSSLRETNASLLRQMESIKFESKKNSLQAHELKRQNERLNIEYRAFEEETLALQIELFSKSNLIDDLNERCAELDRRHDDSSRLQEIQNRHIEDKNNQNNQTRFEIAQLRKELKGLKLLKSDDEKRIQELVNDNESLKQENCDLASIRDRVENEMKSLNRSLACLEDERIELLQKKIDLQNSNKEYETLKIDLNDKITADARTIAALENEIEGLRVKNKCLDSEIEKTSSDLQSLQEELISYKIELDASSRSVRETEDKISILENQYRLLNKNHDDVLNENEALKNDLFEAKNSLSFVSNKLTETEKESQRMANEIDKLNDEMANLNERLMEECQHNERIKEKLNQDIRSLSEDYDRRIAKLNECNQGRIDDLNQLLDREKLAYETRLTDLENEYAQKFSKEQEFFDYEINQMKVKQSQLSRDHNNLILDLESEKQRCLSEANNEKTELADQITKLNELIKNMEQDHESILRDLNSASQSDKEKIESLEEAIKEFTNDMDNIKSGREAAMQKLQNDMLSYEAEKGQLAQKLKDADASLLAYSNEIKHLRDQLLESTEANAKLDNTVLCLNRDICDLKRIIVDMKTEIEILQETKGKNLKQIENLDRRLADLNETLLTTQNKLCKMGDDYEGLLIEKEQLVEAVQEKDCEINSLKDGNEEMEKMLKGLERERKSLFDNSNHLNDTLRECQGRLEKNDFRMKELISLIEELNVDKKNLINSSNNLEAELKSLKNQKALIEQSNGQIEEELSLEKRRNQDLRESLSKSSNESNQQIRSLNDKIDDMQRRNNCLSDTILQTENERREVELKLFSLYGIVNKIVQSKPLNSSQSLTRLEGNARRDCKSESRCRNSRCKSRTELFIEKKERDNNYQSNCTHQCIDINEIRSFFTIFLQRQNAKEKELNEKSFELKKIDSKLKAEIDLVRCLEIKLAKQCSVHDEIIQHSASHLKNQSNDGEIVRHYEEEINDLKKSLIASEERIASLNQESSQIEQENARTQKHINNLQVALQKKEVMLNKLERGHDRLQAQLIECQLEKKTLDGEFERCRMNLSQKENELKYYKNASKEVKETKKAPEKLPATIVNKIAKLEADCKVLKNQLTEQKKLYEKVKASNTELYDRIDNLKKDLAEKEAEKLKMQNKLNSLEERKSLEMPKETIEDKLHETNDNLQQFCTSPKLCCRQDHRAMLTRDNASDLMKECKFEKMVRMMQEEKRSYCCDNKLPRKQQYQSIGPWPRYLSANISSNSKQLAEEALSRGYLCTEK